MTSRALGALLGDVSVDLGWSLIERFSALVRESGSDDERAAGQLIAGELERLGVPYDLYEPELYLSLPRSGSVSFEDVQVRGKPPAFSLSTDSSGLLGKPLHVPAPQARDSASLFKADQSPVPPDVAGRIVVTEGYPMPVAVARFEAAGAMGQVYINPGKNVHWGICTTIWGTPGDGQLSTRPRTPVVAINRQDGDRLLAALDAGVAEIGVHTDLDEGWFPCLLPVARIEGRSEPFVLVHGHYDSWDVGIGDNAVGDATLLELARIFHENRGLLERSLRVAWWPGHSTGRYGGSTWYADRFALELSRSCVAAINIDSPGCWEATAYEELPWMAEAGALCRESVEAVAGVAPARQRPLRAGDYSFNQIGLTSFFMLLSNIPVQRRAELGFYPVGGCGGNIAWHTEDDVLAVADRVNLERDLRVYVRAIGRLLCDEVLPFDFRETADELAEALSGYADQLGDRLDLTWVTDEMGRLRQALDAFYGRVERGEIGSEVVNRTQLRLARLLVPLGYAEGEAFDHDPATPRVPIPKLGRIHELVGLENEAPERVPFLLAEIRRQANKVAHGLAEASHLVGAGP